ncbi:ALS_1a_G0037850.mRNA.1.CDS.1 [Saccharomyces cerevisiae]|nr:Clb4p [Saccharomyces cerevisiae YJM1450]CAI4646127.1 ALS_1a_G0037850.mRNA.1.CDS.1 [Saccharomyces cerevisiae]CAI6815139.1 ALS_1a_G0037850.mRNA.1.CDS.1 [Saccharomyces cerevisiae]
MMLEGYTVQPPQSTLIGDIEIQDENANQEVKNVLYQGVQKGIKRLEKRQRRVALGDVTSQKANKIHNAIHNKFHQTKNNFEIENIRSSALVKEQQRDLRDEDSDYFLIDSSEGSSTDDEQVNEDAIDDLLSRRVNDQQIQADEVYEDFDGEMQDVIEEDVDSQIEPLSPINNDEIQTELDRAFEKYFRSVPNPLDDDTHDVVMVVEYASDIFYYLRELEVKYRPNPYYMQNQVELTWPFRRTMIDWLVQLHFRFQLLPETLYLTINIVDRFLSKKTVTLNRFQLVGVSALFIAAKFEEINCPTLDDLVYMLENTYTRDDIIRAEQYMIDTLEFEIGWPGPMPFLRRISKADDYDFEPRTLAKYLLETTIVEPKLVAAAPSWLAAGAYFLSRTILGSNDWSLKHVFYSGYTSSQIIPLASLILENCKNASRRHHSIWKKYFDQKHYRCSQIVEEWIVSTEA